MGISLETVTTTESGAAEAWRRVTSSPNDSTNKNPLDVSSISATQAIRIDEPDANTTYVGVAAIGTADASALWQIKKISVSGTVTSITWADGNDSYDNIWNNRASLSYS